MDGKELATADKNTTASQNNSSEANQSASPVFVEVERMLDRMTKVGSEIAAKAYDFFQQRGGEFGKEVQDWFNAEAEVLRAVPVEITEQNGNLQVKAAVPGFKPDEIEVSVKDDLLMLSGKTETEEKKEDRNVIYSEWKSNRFLRKLTLPSSVDAENVKAELKDGLLQLTLPKIAPKEAKHITVSAAN